MIDFITLRHYEKKTYQVADFAPFFILMMLQMISNAEV
jgi:hypothetical protein